MSTHERFAPLHAEETSSDRAFGLVFACLFALVSASTMIGGEGPAYAWFLAAAALFLACAVIALHILAPP